MGQLMKRYELVVTTIQERTIWVSAVGPAEAMFEAGRKIEQTEAHKTDQFMKLREIPEEEWDT